MGLSGVSLWQILIVVAVALIFLGPKRLKNFAKEIGKTIKSFKKSMDD